MPPPLALLLTVQHGGHRVPAAFAALFRGQDALLRSHRGWDPGTLALGRTLATRLGVPLIDATITRLLVDLNRSPHNPAVFSRLTRTLPPDTRRDLLAHFHQPHHQRVTDTLTQLLTTHRRVLHLGLHSFTPVLNGCERRMDVGLLYDPARRAEKQTCTQWKAALLAQLPSLRIRFNAPYRGSADGLTTRLRRCFPAARYLGIELELNQALVNRAGRFPADLVNALTAMLNTR